jgi:apocytochrome f
MIDTIKKFKSVFLILGIAGTMVFPKVSYAYPVFAQNAYQNPREATGRIVCANCHLAQKTTEVEVPQAVLPDTVFETVVSIPYDRANKQISASGTKSGLNVGAVVILPEGFKLAPKDRLSDELKAKTKGVFIQPYSKEKTNILVVGPISGDKYQEITFPVLSPDPATDKTVNYLNYPVYVGGNRGRGQVYPTGEKSNNTALISVAAGKVTAIENLEKGKKNLVISTADGETVSQKIPSALTLIVNVGDILKKDQNLSLDPNVGGFGQTETEIILQNPNRVKGMIVFFFTVTVAQILLVLKKKQFEKVQAAEMNF